MELIEEVTCLKVNQARIEERVSDMEEWRKKQNGSLSRLEAKMDRLNQWLIGLLGSVLVSLVLLVVNMLSGR